MSLDLNTVAATHRCQLVRACRLGWPAYCRHNWYQVCRCRGVTSREELHQLIEALDDEQIVPSLHAAVDTLADDLIPAVLARMRAQQQRLVPYPPELFKG